MTTDLRAIRRVCIDCIEQVSAAEKIRQNVVTDAQSRDVAGRRQTLVQDEQMEQRRLTLLARTESVRLQASQIMSGLRLTASASPYQLSDIIEVSRILAFMQQLAESAEGSLVDLRGLAARLETERRKWWKFW